MKKKLRNKTGALVDFLMIFGWALISFGTGIFNLAAGMIVAGALAIVGAVFLGRGLDT
ncbi:MAG: hypothetical protein RR394_10080 [Oscillospiraceae bacterium]